MKKLTENKIHNTEELYIKTIAQQFELEKKQIVKQLRQYGIYTVLTATKNLTAQTLNQYLILKANQLI